MDDLQHSDRSPGESEPKESPPIPVARPADPSLSQAPALAPDRWWAPRPITRLQALGDILIVIVVLVVPQTAAALVGSSVHTVPEPPPVNYILGANSMIWATVALVAIYLTYRSGQPLSSIGFRRVNPLAAISAAVLATIAIYAFLFVTALLAAALTRASHETMTAPAREIFGLLGPPSWLSILVIAGSAAVFEEIVFRGFILTRLRVLLGNWTIAILAGAVLFAVPHIWQGRWAVLLVVPVAIVLSVTFVRRRSLWAAMLAHFLFNFLQLAALRALQTSPQWQDILRPTS